MLGACNGWRFVSGFRIELSSGSAEPTLLEPSSRLTSRSQVRLNSSEARRNSARFLPNERLICGSLRGPKKTSAIIRIKTNSVLPSDSRISKTNFDKHLLTRSEDPVQVEDCNPRPDKPEIRKLKQLAFPLEPD